MKHKEDKKTKTKTKHPRSLVPYQARVTGIPERDITEKEYLKRY